MLCRNLRGLVTSGETQRSAAEAVRFYHRGIKGTATFLVTAALCILPLLLPLSETLLSCVRAIRVSDLRGEWMSESYDDLTQK